MSKTDLPITETPLKGDEFLSTSEAARLLGISVGTVQQMVESGTLTAWKTAGGHRRIYSSSVRAMLGAAIPASEAQAEADASLSVLVVDDDPVQRRLYEARIGSLGLQIDLRLVPDGFTALLEAGKHIPDVMVIDLMMEGMNGFELIKRLRTNPTFDTTDIIVVTSLDNMELKISPPLPADVTILHKPVPFHELSGFLRACLAAKLRRVPSPRA